MNIENIYHLRHLFPRSDYQQLVYNAIGSNSRRKIHLLPPCIWKPKQLWTGKQVFLSYSIGLSKINFSPSFFVFAFQDYFNCSIIYSTNERSAT